MGEIPAQITSRTIKDSDDVAEGAAFLARIEPRFAHALQFTGALPLRRRKGGFEALLSAIVSQQISVAAADAIWKRLKSARLTGPRKVSAASDDALRACGLSGQKVRYAKSLAQSGINYRALEFMPDGDVIAALIQVVGIGNWTAEIYAMFSLGRADVFAPGDLALQESARMLFDLDSRPGEKEMRAMALAWSPWQAVAARLLWDYYRVAKQREGIR